MQNVSENMLVLALCVVVYINYHYTVSTLPNKTISIIKQNWNQFLLVVKATALKQQISKFYSQILSTEASLAFTFMTSH